MEFIPATTAQMVALFDRFIDLTLVIGDRKWYVSPSQSPVEIGYEQGGQAYIRKDLL